MFIWRASQIISPSFKKNNLRTNLGYIIFYNLGQKNLSNSQSKIGNIDLLLRAVCKKLLYIIVPKVYFYTLANEKRDFKNDYWFEKVVVFARDYKQFI